MSKEGIRNVIIFWVIILCFAITCIYDSELAGKILLGTALVAACLYLTYLVYMVATYDE